MGFFIAPAGMLLGLIVVGGDEDDATLLGRIRAPLAEVAGRAGLTLQTTLDLARGLGVTVPAGATSHPSLTARERQIATLIAQGYSNLNVSARLGIAADTVSVHVRRIYRKLGVHSRVELAARLASD